MTMNTTPNSTQASDGMSHELYMDIILAILASLAVLFNGVLLFVLWKNKAPEFRLGTSYVIGNLALADCLTGIAMLLYVTHITTIDKFQLPMVWTTIEASLTSLMFLSIERTVAFHFPLASKSILTVKRTIMAIVTIWTFAISCGIFVYFYRLETQLAMTIMFEICVIVFLVCQGYIILEMQKRRRRNPLCDRDVSIKTRKHIQGRHMNNHVTKVVLILIIVVVVTLLPYMVAMQIYFLHILKLSPPLDDKDEKILKKFIHYFYPIELLNFIVNPVIYAYRLKRYRMAFFNAFSFLQCGPFVKERARTLSNTSNEYNHDYQRSQKKLIVKSDANLNNINSTRF